MLFYENNHSVAFYLTLSNSIPDDSLEKCITFGASDYKGIHLAGIGAKIKFIYPDYPPGTGFWLKKKGQTIKGIIITSEEVYDWPKMQVIDKENLESLIKDLKFQEFILKHLGDKNSDFNLTLVKKSSKNDPTSEILKYIKKCNDLKIDNEYTQPICKAIVENYCLILKNNIIELNNKILPSVDYLNFDRATKSTIFECCCLDKDKFAVKGILLDKRDKPNVRGSGTKWYKYQPTSKKSRTWIPKASIDTEDSFSVKFLDIDKKTHNEIWKKAEEYKPSMPLNNRKIYLEQNNMIICKLNLNMIKEEGSIWPGIRVIVSLPNKSHDNKIKCLRLNANKSASNLNDKAKKLINGLLKIFIEEHKNKPKVPRPKTKHFPGGKADPLFRSAH